MCVFGPWYWSRGQRPLPPFGDLSLNPTEIYSFYYVALFEKKIKKCDVSNCSLQHDRL